ncbi:hypothetical protein VP395_02010 [Mariniflexile soesokkakense]|uniref:Lipoprotein n=1 Tax=Mariniflexile soesokkakense TaxID=1343160 RepID=A0ABV0A6G0_9FLAO
MKKIFILIFIFLIICSCNFKTKNYNIEGNWILTIDNDSTYAEVNFDSKSDFKIYYNHNCFPVDIRKYKIKYDTFLFNKSNKYYKCVFRSFDDVKISLENITYRQIIRLYRISDTAFTADKCRNFEDQYKYEVMSKNRMFKFKGIDSIIALNYENYLKKLPLLNMDDETEVDIPIIIENKTK